MLAGRAPVVVEIDEIPDERLPEPVEAAAYYLIAEALTNVAKYARPSTARVRVATNGTGVVVEVSDDGIGGADPAKGSGLRGLAIGSKHSAAHFRYRAPTGAARRCAPRSRASRSLRTRHACSERRDERFDHRDGVVHQLAQRLRAVGVGPAACGLELRGGERRRGHAQPVVTDRPARAGGEQPDVEVEALGPSAP